MTVFGAVWLFLLGVAVLKKQSKFLITLVLFSTTLQSSNVFMINGQGIGPQIITSMIVTFYLLIPKISKLKFTIYKDILNVRYMMIILLISVIFSCNRTGTFIENCLRILQIMFYIGCFFALYEAGKKLDKDYIYNTIVLLVIFILIVGVIQIIITGLDLPRYSIIRDVFWNDSANAPNIVQFGWPYGKYFRFFATYMEPSYFVGFSVGAIFYFLNYKKDRRKANILLIGLFIATILSFSSAGYGALLITAIIYMAFSKDGKAKVFILISGILGFAILYFGFYGILDSVIFSKFSSASYAARKTWNIQAMLTFQQSPIFGVGYKNCRASNLFYTLLAEQGIFGMVIYILFIISIIKNIITKKKQNKIGNEQVGIIFAIIAVVATQMIAVPDLDICTFWMWMNMFAISMGIRYTGNKSITDIIRRR